LYNFFTKFLIADFHAANLPYSPPRVQQNLCGTG
jgi:hypothetical protein